MKLLVTGDSFAADWKLKNDSYPSWWEYLANDHDVTNLAQAGVGEYKILKQILSVDIKHFDYIIISHTSPYRIHTLQNPFHTTGIHKNSDLIYIDVLHQSPSPEKSHCIFWFENMFDTEYALEVHWLIREKIDLVLANKNILHLNFFDKDLQKEKDIDLKYLWSRYPGPINHMNKIGNQKAYETISKNLWKKNDF